MAANSFQISEQRCCYRMSAEVSGEQLHQSTDIFSSALLNRTWQLHQVTEPLISSAQFQQTDLNILEKLLLRFIRREDRRSIIGSNAYVHTVRATWMTNELSSSTLQFHALFIDLTNVDGTQRPLFTGVLCSVQSQNDVQDTYGTWLPLFLTSGSSRLKTLVKQFLEKRYRFRISAFQLSPVELSWCAAIWAHADPDIPMKNFNLKYLSPPEIRGIASVTVTVLSNDINHLWESIHDVEANEFHEHEVQAFFKALQQHIFQSFRLKLEAFRLHEVITASMILNHHGQIKVFSKRNVLHILKHLTSIVLVQIIGEIA